MTESKKSQPPMPPPKEGESILEYSIRIGGDKRTPDQIKNDSLKVGQGASKETLKEKDNNQA